MPKTTFEVPNPVTQSLDAVKSLLTYAHRPVDLMPTEVSLENGRLVLVLSSKKDAYYCTTSRARSCPAAAYHPGQRCKHQKKYFPLCDDVVDRAMAQPFCPHER